MIPVTEPNPLKIFVIEDNYGDFFLLKEDFDSLDIPVESVENADSVASAIQYLGQNKPDIIFLDLFLPDNKGISSYNELKPFIDGAAVIILSGLSDKKTALQAIANGAQDYLTKGDFDKKLLEKTISYAIERVKNLERLSIANHRFNLVVKATRDLIWDWDLATGKIYRDAQSAKEVYGIDETKSIIDIQDWLARFHPDDTTRVYAMVAEIKRASSDFFEVQYRVRADNGEFRFIFERGYVVRDSDGRPTRLIGAAQDITQKIKLEKIIQETRMRQLKTVAAATIRGQENERKRLGIELHDNITQILATSRLYLDNAMSGQPQNEMLNRSRDMIVLATRELRKLSHELLPPSQEFGLKQAMEDMVETIAGTGVLKFENSWDEFDEDLLNEDQQLTIYRIVQEQLNNIVKHAGASKVNISLGLSDDARQIELLIKDNGKGFDPCEKRKGVGLRNIISRSELYDGNVSIHSRPGKGCVLQVVFPSVQSPVVSIGFNSRSVMHK